MKLEPIHFRGIQVGLKIVAETGEERVLLRTLAGHSAFGDTTGGAPCARLTLCPKLPWDNLPAEE